MPSASSRMRTPRYKTERLNLQALPQREEGAVATVRILNVGAKAAARSGRTWQIPGPVQPGQPMPEPPTVIYARPVRSAPTWQEGPYEPRTGFVKTGDNDPNVVDTHRQRIAALRTRAAGALSSLQANLPTQRIELGTWKKPSTGVMCAAVAMYALALFLFALLGR